MRKLQVNLGSEDAFQGAGGGSSHQRIKGEYVVTFPKKYWKMLLGVKTELVKKWFSSTFLQFWVKRYFMEFRMKGVITCLSNFGNSKTTLHTNDKFSHLIWVCTVLMLGPITSITESLKKNILKLQLVFLTSINLLKYIYYYY